jgi:hypothetical protein
MSDIDTDASAPGPVPNAVPPPHTYVFLLLPWKRVEPVFNRLFTYSIFGALEGNFVARRAPAHMIKLVDGSVAYRMDAAHLPKFQFDAIGYFVDLYSFGVHRFVTTDPTLSMAPNPRQDMWLPVGNA